MIQEKNFFCVFDLSPKLPVIELSNLHPSLCSSLYYPLPSPLPSQGGEAGYRAAVCEVVPTLQVLDDMPLRPVPEDQEVGVAKEEDMSARSSLFSFNETGMEKDWQILQQSIKQGLQLEQGQSRFTVKPATCIQSASVPKLVPN